MPIAIFYPSPSLEHYAVNGQSTLKSIDLALRRHTLRSEDGSNQQHNTTKEIVA